MPFPPPGKSYVPTAAETAVMREMLGAMPLAAKREMTLREQVSVLLFTVTFYANHAYNLTCSP
jgi:hypothetical protein